MNTFATILTNEKYLEGTVALFNSFRMSKSMYPFTCFIPEESQDVLEPHLRAWGIPFVAIRDHYSEIVTPSDNRVYSHWGKDCFFKLNLLSQGKYMKIVFLDSDMAILKNVDDLMDRRHLSGVACKNLYDKRTTWFNSGLLVMEPRYEYREEIEETILNWSDNEGMKQGDEGILNKWYSTNQWNGKWWDCTHLHIPEEYNLWYTLANLYQLNFKWTFDRIKIVHFLGKKKPWNEDLAKQPSGLRKDLVEFWHKCRNYTP